MTRYLSTDGELVAQKHVQFILSVEKKRDSLEAVAMEHPRMNGEYWCLTILDLLGKLQAVDVDEVGSKVTLGTSHMYNTP